MVFAAGLRTPLGSFGLTASQSEASSLMTKTVFVLKAKLLELRIKLVAYTWIHPTTREGVSSSLPTLDNIIARLDGSSRNEVLAGTLPLYKWISSAQTVSDGIVAKYKILQDGSFANLVSQQMNQAIDELVAFATATGQGAKEVWDVAKYVLPVAIIGGLGLTIYMLPAIRKVMLHF